MCEVAQTYNRAEAIVARARLMEDWAAFLAGESPAAAEVIPLRA